MAMGPHHAAALSGPVFPSHRIPVVCTPLQELSRAGLGQRWRRHMGRQRPWKPARAPAGQRPGGPDGTGGKGCALRRRAEGGFRAENRWLLSCRFTCAAPKQKHPKVQYARGDGEHIRRAGRSRPSGGGCLSFVGGRFQVVHAWHRPHGGLQWPQQTSKVPSPSRVGVACQVNSARASRPHLCPSDPTTDVTCAFSVHRQKS